MICYNKGYPFGLISSGSVFGVKCISTCDVMYAFYFLIKETCFRGKSPPPI